MLLLIQLIYSMIIPPWKDTRIHNLGNHGLLGYIHALVAKSITEIIDEKVYKGYNVRSLLHENKNAVDFGCGTGTSTPNGAIGVDCSKEMLHVARSTHPDKQFVRGLAERWGVSQMVSVSICSFLLHEQPMDRRHRILKNAYRVCRDYMLIMDIDPLYKPSFMMLLGEPYILDYLDNIDSDIFNFFDEYSRTEVVPGHVILWNITKIGE